MDRKLARHARLRSAPPPSPRLGGAGAFGVACCVVICHSIDLRLDSNPRLNLRLIFVLFLLMGQPLPPHFTPHVTTTKCAVTQTLPINRTHPLPSTTVLRHQHHNYRELGTPVAYRRIDFQPPILRHGSMCNNIQLKH